METYTQNHMLLLLQSHTRIADKNKALQEQLECATERIRRLELTVHEKEAQIEESKMKIMELEYFSEGVANLHKALASETDMRRKFEVLQSGDYANDQDVQEWKDFTSEFLEEEKNEVPYLKTLKDSIEVYRKVIMPRLYSARFLSIFSNAPPNVGFYTRFGTLYKIHVPCRVKWVRMNKTVSVTEFEKKACKDYSGYRTSEYVTSYYENDCLDVYLRYHCFMHKIALLPHYDHCNVLEIGPSEKTRIKGEYLKHTQLANRRRGDVR